MQQRLPSIQNAQVLHWYTPPMQEIVQQGYKLQSYRCQRWNCSTENELEFCDMNIKQALQNLQ